MQCVRNDIRCRYSGRCGTVWYILLLIATVVALQCLILHVFSFFQYKQFANYLNLSC